MRSYSHAAAAAQTQSRASKSIAIICRACFALAILTLLVAGTALPVAADDRPPGGAFGNPVVRAIDLASPAVVRIATLFTAQLTLTACGSTVTLPSSGSYTVGGLGSGAFVSAHGDILTADHVVDIDHADLDNVIFQEPDVSTDVAAFLNTACNPQVPVTANDVVNGIVQFNQFPFSTQYSAPQILVWRSTSYLGTLSSGNPGDASNGSTQLSGLMQAPHDEAQVVNTSSFTQNDVALLHVGLSDTPSIQLDPSSQLAVEDPLTVIGFPGNGDVNADPTNLLTPSVNNVNISAFKRNDNGAQLIQVGGNVEHGDSGGPALDAAGHIVGIVSFGGSDVPGITAFLRSSDNALSLISGAHIDTTPGNFEKLWRQAFTDYTATTSGHWGHAAQEMDALSTKYPDFHGLDVYRQYADAAAAREATAALRVGPPMGLVIALAMLVVVAIAVAALGIFLVLRTRRRAAQGAWQPSIPVPGPVWQSSPLPPLYNGVVAPTVPSTPQTAPMPPQYGVAPQQTYFPQQTAGAPQPPTMPYSSTAYTVPNGAPGTAADFAPNPSLRDAGAALPVVAPSLQDAHQPPTRTGEPDPAPPYAPPTPHIWGEGAGTQSPPTTPGPTLPSYPPQPAQPTQPARPAQHDTVLRNDFCVNGHAMAPWSTQCPVCGAERAPASPASPAAGA